MRKYIVVDETLYGSSVGDAETEVFDTPEAANSGATSLWNHLTQKEQEMRHIYAAVVTESILDDCAKNEDSGEIDWRCWMSCDAFPGAFDSDALVEGHDAD